MKNFYVTILLTLFSVISIQGQETIKHIVQRGETFESIAKDYNLSQTELQSVNYDMDIFYTGLEINIPVKKPAMASSGADQSSDSDEQFMNALSSYQYECDVADKLFEAKSYSKAQKQYQQIIKKYKGVLPCEDALYGNALCSYNREKWKSAIKDLSAVAYNEECSQEQRDHCKGLLVKAQSYRDQQLENRSNFWGGMLVAAAAVGTSVALASSQSKQSSYSSSSTSSVSASSSSVSSYSSEGSSTSASSSSNSSCPSLKANRGKYYCANTGRCGMCGGDGCMDDQLGDGANSHKCTLCGGTGKCKYCQ